MRRGLLALALLVAGRIEGAPGLTIAKTSTVISDEVSSAIPKALPGATIDYAITAANAALNPPVAGVVITDIFVPDGAAPPRVKLRVADYQTAGEGPVRFTNVTVAGVFASGVAYSYAGLASATDGLEFYDGTSWTYQPVADADGCDARVRGIRVTLTGAQVAGGAFRLNFRVRVR